MNGGSDTESRMNSKVLEYLITIIENWEEEAISLAEARIQLEKVLAENEVENHIAIAENAIKDALDNWIVDKVIDYVEDEVSERETDWFLRTLTSEERKHRSELSDVKKEFIKILRECEVDGRLGVILESDAIQQLMMRGFDVDFVPHIAGLTGEFVRFADDGESIIWHYLVPKYELDDMSVE